jgi:hypothetical protein
MEDSTKTPNDMEAPSTDDEQGFCQPTPYADPDLHERPRAAKKQKRAEPKTSKTKQFKECKSSLPGLTITCRIYNRRAETEHDYELDLLACEAGVTPEAVWAFSNHESLLTIPSYNDCIRLDCPVLTDLINTNMQTNCDVNTDISGSASDDDIMLTGLTGAATNAIQQATMAMTDTPTPTPTPTPAPAFPLQVYLVYLHYRL